MRAIWKGTISFGLVSIPISLYPATRREDLKFHLLRASDLSRVNFKRVAEADGKEVPWDKIVKGYEYEKDKFVVLKDEDFNRADVEATQTVDIINFVALDDINPLLFYKPYFMEVGKGGDKAYTLLRDALISSKKIGIAKVVIKVRQHLAAIKPQGTGLMLELMHFPEELMDAAGVKAPAAKHASPAELKMATQLIASMTTGWKPEMYHDDYHDALEKLIEKKIAHGGEKLSAPTKTRKATNAIDLVSVLQQSIRETAARGKSDGQTKSRDGKTPKAAPKIRTKAKLHRHHLN
ncbi:MAG TPA: Ku protein [Verrucomicrobiae bacterium]|nr:Ku protein [Verrucomicrobiae bacterium]